MVIRPDAAVNHRTRAFCALFEGEFGQNSAIDALTRSEQATPLPEEQSARTTTLINGVSAHRAELDALIDATADRLPPGQIALVDRIILRIALYEMLFDNGAVRPNTAVRQAVNLARRFGGEPSRRFASGVLGEITRNRLQAGTAE